eukprot:403376348
MMIPASKIAQRVRDRSQLNQNSQTLTLNTLQHSASSRGRINDNSVQSIFFAKRNSSQVNSNQNLIKLSNSTSKPQLLQQPQIIEDQFLVSSSIGNIKKTHSEQSGMSQNQTGNRVRLPYITTCIRNDQLEERKKSQYQRETFQLIINKKINYNHDSIERSSEYSNFSATFGPQNFKRDIQEESSTFKKRHTKQRRVNPDILIEQLVSKQNEIKHQQSKVDKSKNQSANGNCSLEDINYLAATQNLRCSNICGNKLQKCQNTSCSGQICEPEYLNYHGISENHRLRMIDWMIQVFRVLGKQVTKTFVLATQIMDKFYLIKMLQGTKQNKADLHIVGLTSIFIASKYEDVHPILMRQILNEAAHGKYQKSQILQQEQDILQTLEFKVHEHSFYDETCEQIQGLIQMNNNESENSQIINQQDRKHLFVLAGFFSQIVLHSSELAHQDIQVLSSAIVSLTLKYYKNYSSAQLLQFVNGENIMIKDKSLVIKSYISQQIYLMFKQGLINKYSDFQLAYIRELRNKITKKYINFQKDHPNQQNLQKNAPNLFAQDSIMLLSKQ